ncbi:hypothetical protein GZS10_26380 [Raoultella ornithinolytica]|nr:hypothetical protein GZS10_26380 [Raoultella ornithinolytica]
MLSRYGALLVEFLQSGLNLIDVLAQCPNLCQHIAGLFQLSLGAGQRLLCLFALMALPGKPTNGGD